MTALAGLWVLGWISGAVRALVLMKGWEWFVAPLGAPSLGFIEAWGLGFLVSFATYQWNNPEPPDDPWVVALTAFATSLVISGMAIVSLLILVSLR